MPEQKSAFEGVSLVLIVGIFVTIAPFIMSSFGWNGFGWLFPVGVVLIVIGSVITIINR